MTKLFYVRSNKKNESLKFIFTINFSRALAYFMYIKIFSCLWRTSFNIFWKASLLAMNSFSFYLSEKVWISPSLLRNNFSGYRILDWCFFLLTFYIFHTLFLLHGFQGEVGYNYYLCSSVGKVFLFSKFFPSGFFFF